MPTTARSAATAWSWISFCFVLLFRYGFLLSNFPHLDWPYFRVESSWSGPDALMVTSGVSPPAGIRIEATKLIKAAAAVWLY
jgi:hypothetical protein